MRYGPANKTIVDEAHNRVVPCDPNNTDYQEIVQSGVPIGPYIEPPPTDKRAAKYQARVDQWTHAIVRYQVRLLDARLTTQQKAKIQQKLDAAILKVQDESTAIETETPDE